MTQSAAGGVKAQCSKRVYWDAWHSHPCANKGTVERDGKPYCGVHDPQKVAARQARRDASYLDAREEQDAKWKAADARARALGGGMAFHDGPLGYTGGIVLSPEQADALIARLVSV